MAITIKELQLNLKLILITKHGTDLFSQKQSMTSEMILMLYSKRGTTFKPK
jgi:hypothetical protein